MRTLSSVTEYPAGPVLPNMPVTALEVKVHNNVGMVLFYHTTDVGTTNQVTVKTFYVFADGTEVEYDTDTWDATVPTNVKLRVQKYQHKVDHLRIKITSTGTDGGAIRIQANVSEGA
jgi:hypothetical protein